MRDVIPRDATRAGGELRLLTPGPSVGASYGRRRVPFIRAALGLVLLYPTAVIAQPRGRVAPAPDPLAGFDDYAVNAMHEWKVPGMAVAVVRGDSVLLLRGYGVRTRGESPRVDGHTMFAIGSATKAFTGDS